MGIEELLGDRNICNVPSRPTICDFTFIFAAPCNRQSFVCFVCIVIYSSCSFRNPKYTRKSPGTIIGKSTYYSGPWVYARGSLVIALVCPLVRPSVFEYLGNSSLVFSETLHKVGDP